jgi:hypothetical protein
MLLGSAKSKLRMARQTSYFAWTRIPSRWLKHLVCQSVPAPHFCHVVETANVWCVQKTGSHKQVSEILSIFRQRHAPRRRIDLGGICAIPQSRQPSGRACSQPHAMTDCRIYGTLPCVSRLLFVSVEVPSRTNVISTNTTLEQLAKWPSVRGLMAGRRREISKIRGLPCCNAAPA